MMEQSTIDKMKPYQILKNLEIVGIKIDWEETIIPYTEEWAERIFDENKELFDKTSKEEFIKYVLYGRCDI